MALCGLSDDQEKAGIAAFILVIVTMLGVVSGYGLGIGNQAVFIVIVVVLLLSLVLLLFYYCWYVPRRMKKSTSNDDASQSPASDDARQSSKVSAQTYASIPTLTMASAGALSPYTPYSEA